MGDRVVSPGPGPGGEWRPTANPWLITVAVMLATFMEILDTTIASVALPHIAGSLSASNDEATWVLTSYLVSNAVILPASAWLAQRFGRKRFLVACIVVFTLASVASGAALSLGMLVAARVLQGAGGGALQPLSQAILLESFPPEKRGMAMAAFGLGVVVAPIAGPTLGGWLTDNYSWRWAFYINLPIGLLAIAMIQAFVEDPPYIRDARPGRIDAIGFGLMAVALATLQILLDKGQEDDWFSAVWIRWFALICAVSMVAFVVRELRTPEPVVNLRVFRNRNFAVGTLLITLVGVTLYSAVTILPLFLQTLMGYPALQSGLAVSPRGIGGLLAMPVIGFLTARVDFRKLVATGFLLVGASLWVTGNLTLQISAAHIAWPSVTTGVGLSMIFVPLAAVSMGTLAQREMGNASGIFNLMRNIGGSVGIACISTLIARWGQAYQAGLVAHVTPWSHAPAEQLKALQRYLAVQLGPFNAAPAAHALQYKGVVTQARLLAFVQSFRTLAILCAFCILLAFFLKRVARRPPVSSH